MQKRFKTIAKFLPLFFLFLLQASCAKDPIPAPQNTLIHEQVYENDFTAVVQEFPGTGLAALNLIFRTGSADEGNLCGYGLSHLIEHLMIRSSLKHPKEGEIEKIIKTLGGTFNASTSADTVSIYITVPKDNLHPALDLIHEMAFSPNLNDAVIIKEKKVVHKEIILYADNPDAEVNERLWKLAFHAHPYQHPVLGYPHLFELVTPEEVRTSYQRFTPNIAVLAVAGDVNAQDVFAAVEKYIPSMPKPCYQPASIPDVPAQILSRALTTTFDADMARLNIGFLSANVLDPDIYALDVLAVILGQGEASRLQQKIIKKLQLAQSIGVANDTLSRKGLFTIYATLKPENYNTVKALIFDELKQLQEKKISHSELTRAQKLLLSNYVSSRASLEAIASSLSRERVLTGDAQFSQKYIQEVARVTPTQVQNVAKKYFSQKKANFSILNPRSYVDPDAITTPSKPSQNLLWEEKSLKNGIRTVAIQNTFTPTTSVTVLFKGGLLAETTSTNGISKICAQMLLRAEKDRQDLSTILENRGIRLQSFADDNSFGIRASMLVEELPFALKNIARVLQDPFFSSAELESVKKRSLLDIQAENDNMFSRGFNLLKKTIFKDHPYGFSVNGTLQSVPSVTLKNLTDFYKTYAVPENMIISISGDMPPSRAIQEVEKIFSRLPSSSSTPSFASLDIQPITHNETIVTQVDRQGAVVLFGYSGIRMAEAAFYSFEVLNSIMSGYNGRLLHQIRNAQSLTYTQHFFSLPGYGNGFFGAFAGTSAENQEKVIQGIKKQIALLQKNSVSDREILDSKREILTRYLSRKQDNGFLASKAAQYILYGLSPEAFFSYESNILAVTKADIEAAIRFYILEKPCVQLLLTSQSPKKR